MHEQAALRTLREFRLEWQQELEKLLLQPLEPEVEALARQGLGRLVALAAPPPSRIPVQFSADSERTRYLDELARAVEDF